MRNYIGHILEGIVEQDMQNKWLVYFHNEQIDGLLPKDHVPFITETNTPIDGLIIGVKRSPTGDVYDVDRGNRFLIKLADDLDCVQEGLVTIKKVAREPGNKSKVLVAGDTGLFIGKWGCNTQYLIDRLHDKTMDVIPDNGNLSTKGLILEALNIHKPMYIELDELYRRAIVYVPRSIIGAVYGTNKINLKLATDLIDYHISVKTLRDSFIYDNDFPNEVIEDLIKARIMTSNDLYYLVSDGLGKEKLSPDTIDYINDTLQTEEEDDVEVYECPECGKSFKGELTKCPWCGVEIEYEG